MIEEIKGTNANKANFFMRFFTRSILTKITVFVGAAMLLYVIYTYFQATLKESKKSLIETTKSDNTSNEIFDLIDSESHENIGDSEDLSNVNVNELQEKGANFIYQMLLKNQMQINDLKEQMQSLKNEFLKYKSHEKLGNVIFSYIELRQKIFTEGDFEKNYEESLKNLEILSGFDNTLHEKIMKLRPLLKDFFGKKNITAAFNSLIPEIISTKNNGDQNNFFDKVRHNVAKLITIRRIDGKTPEDVDGIIAKVEKLLQEQNYQESYAAIMFLDKTYHEILSDFLNKLNNAAEIQELDREILFYLKSLN